MKSPSPRQPLYGLLLALPLLTGALSSLAQTAAHPAPAPATAASRRALLVGTWQSTDDAQNVLRFDQKKQYALYNKQLLTTSIYSLTDRCSCPNEKSAVLKKEDVLVTNDEDGCMCYRILQLDRNKLILSYITRGNTLSFKRIKP